MDYEKGFKILKKLIELEDDQTRDEFYNFQSQFLINWGHENSYGLTDTIRGEKYRIIAQLDKITYRIINKNFSDLCNEMIINCEQLTEIISLFYRVDNLPSNNELQAICEQCVPNHLGYLQKYHEKNMLNCILINLAKISTLSTGDVPILKFAFYMSEHKSTAQISNDLKQWIGKVSQQQQLPAPVETVNQSSESISKFSSAPLYLLIQIEPQQKNLENYIAQAWLFRGENLIGQVYPTQKHEGQTFTLKTLPELVAELLDSIEDYLAQPLTMEFILPKNLLNHHIEDICLPDDKFPIGIDYRIIIRSWERLQHKPASRRCRRYWNLYKTMPKKIWIHVEQDCCSILDDGAIFFGLSFPPSKKYLLELIESGVPIMLWPKHRHPEKITQQIQKFISNRQLEELPERIRKIRRQFWQITNKQHTGYLSLLWEGTDRIPPKPQLQAPDLQL